MKKESETGRGSRLHFLCFTALIMLMLAGCGVYMRLTPDVTYSAQERRMLKKRPRVTKKRILNGKFQKAYEKYLCEQFPWRTGFVTLRTRMSRLMGEKDANGVYFGSDNYLLERHRQQDYDWEEVQQKVDQTADFLKKYPGARVMLVPSKSSVLKDKLPSFAPEPADARFFKLAGERIPPEQQIPVQDELDAHNGEYIYYRTDHHWTTLGAYYAYRAWAQYMGFKALEPEAFHITDVCDTFLGTTYAKVRTGGLADTISLYERREHDGYRLDYNMGESVSDSFYDKSMLEGDDPYSVFFGGNQPLVDIKNRQPDKAGRKKTLMIIKDSFGNCFAPLAANHYKRTIVVDLRYVNIPVESLLSVYPADDILILYNSIQFMEDQNIGKLK